MNGGEALVETLLAWGVDAAFSVPVVLGLSELYPVAVLLEPVLFLKLFLPSAVL